jgi:arylsulfatase A-like enzyme
MMNSSVIRRWLVVLACGAGAGLCLAAERPNVLLIAVDDLNHWVGHLGRNPQAKTPHIDRLANMGVTFTRAYTAAPACNPSRAALLSGKRPGVTGIYDNTNPYAVALKPEGTLISQFKTQGYRTLGMGKLWHGGLGWAAQWSATGGRPVGGDHGTARVEDRSIGALKFGVMEGGDASVPDTQIADYAISELGKAQARPFFLAVGFHKPHMPWYVPQKYYDLHPLESIQLPPHRTNDVDDLPAVGAKFAGASGTHAEVVASGRWKEAVQAYLATVSYLDGQIGRVLDALEKSAFASNTVICFWGDHGWHLGEKQHWRKFALWEEATRTPFIWVVPGVTRPGGRCDRTVDLMSVYPTLCDLAGIVPPAGIEPASLRPLLVNPKASWDRPAITTYGRNNHAVRTEEWRYIRYHDGGEELYDHKVDPYEWDNVASDAARSSVKQRLAALLPTADAPEVRAPPRRPRRNLEAPIPPRRNNQ